MDSHKHTPCYVIHKCSHSIMEGDPNVTRLPKYIPNNNSKKKTLPINKNYIKIKTQKPVSTHEIPLKKHKPINQNHQITQTHNSKSLTKSKAKQ